jgi:5-methylcytosine-specific restriction endonuclease McrA
VQPKRKSKIKAEVICLNCKGLFIPHRKSFGKYCSNACQVDYEWKCTKEEIRKTGIAKSQKEAKRFLVDEHGHKCMICNFTAWMEKPIPLVLDHIDGLSDNWKLKNLRIICANCDRQTDTFGSKNTGNGRKARLEKHHEKQIAVLKREIKIKKLKLRLERM